MKADDPNQILQKILYIDHNNDFLKYIVRRLHSDEYRGWHISQHNRYGLSDVSAILQAIKNVVNDGYFAIPPGDYDRNTSLTGDFNQYEVILSKIQYEINKGTINSVKKNFFPDLERMSFLQRERTRVQGRTVMCGKLTQNAINFTNAHRLIDKYKIYTDCIDKLFGNKISALAEMILLSDYADDPISIYEFMFILSDNDEDFDKIRLLSLYRRLSRHERKKLIELVKEYAQPKNFCGNKTAKRDFHNWKNQAQQIMLLLKSTVYFQVEPNKYFRLNYQKTGFFQKPNKRSIIPKREYFKFHKVSKKDKFELHHIVPISEAKNKEEAQLIDDYRNLIYVHRRTHKVISENRNKNVVLTINSQEAIFSDFENEKIIKTTNRKDALYTQDGNKVKKIARYNSELLKSIFEFEQ